MHPEHGVEAQGARACLRKAMCPGSRQVRELYVLSIALVPPERRNRAARRCLFPQAKQRSPRGSEDRKEKRLKGMILTGPMHTHTNTHTPPPPTGGSWVYPSRGELSAPGCR